MSGLLRAVAMMWLCGSYVPNYFLKVKGTAKKGRTPYTRCCGELASNHASDFPSPLFHPHKIYASSGLISPGAIRTLSTNGLLSKSLTAWSALVTPGVIPSQQGGAQGSF